MPPLTPETEPGVYKFVRRDNKVVVVNTNNPEASHFALAQELMADLNAWQEAKVVSPPQIDAGFLQITSQGEAILYGDSRGLGLPVDLNARGITSEVIGPIIPEALVKLFRDPPYVYSPTDQIRHY